MGVKNITYLFGAGASYQAFPILNELSEAIGKFFENPDFSSKIEEQKQGKSVKNPYSPESNIEYYLAYEFSELSILSDKFNTVDTYAKMLFLNKKFKELHQLKNNLSLFLSLWQRKTNKVKHSRPEGKKKFRNIDPRYIALIASFVTNNQQISINENINFITWNYDLQLELAFGLFAELTDLNEIDQLFCFQPINSDSKLKVCHLNGYGGYVSSEEKKAFVLNEINFESSSIRLARQLKNNSIHKLLNSNRGDDMISFAWENNLINKIVRTHAEKILSETDILVIIGYSFPVFNREIDNILFNSLLRSGKVERIYYQSPDANESFLRETFNIPDGNLGFATGKVAIDKGIPIIIRTDNMDQFVIPKH